jgi:FkbM family methyltransferase
MHRPFGRKTLPLMKVLDCCATFDVPVDGLIHIGANRANEYPSYHARTSGPLLYIEAIPDMSEYVAAKLDPQRPHFVRQAVVSDTSGETVRFNVSSNDGKSSSLLGLGRHATIYPHVKYETVLSLVTERMDDVVAERPEHAQYNVLVIDVQGAELKVLKGAPSLLANVDAVFTEVSSEPLYEGGCTFLEITNFLASAGFVFRSASMKREGWGDAFYSRSRTRLHALLHDSLALKRPARQSSFYRKNYPADAAVDGVLATDFSIHTAEGDAQPWWEVDLGCPTDIRRIICLDRPKFEARAASMSFSTSLDGANYDVVYRRDSKHLDAFVDARIRSTARFVRVKLDDGGPLHFRQLIVV